MIASMIEKEVQVAEGAPAGRRGDLQPARGRRHARDRRDAPLRASTTTTSQLLESELADRRPLQHPRRRRACRRRRSRTPGLASMEAAAEPGEDRRLLLRGQARAPAASTSSPPARPSSTRPRPSTRPPSRPRAARRPTADDGSAGWAESTSRLAVVGHPVAHSLSPRDADGGARGLGLAGEWSYEAIEPGAGRVRAAIGGLPRTGLRPGVNVTIPHKAAALALADEATARRGGDRRRQHAQLRATGRDPSPTTPTRPRPDRALRRASIRPGSRALVLGAGGSARAAVWALRGGGRRGRGLEPDPRRARPSWPPSSASRRCATRPSAAPRAIPRPRQHDLRRARHADDSSSDPVQNSRRSGFGADQLNDRQVVVDLAYGSAETELIKAAKGRGANGDRRTRDPGPPGRGVLRIWTGHRASADGDDAGSAPPAR